jgi:hypothetical protein
MSWHRSVNDVLAQHRPGRFLVEKEDLGPEESKVCVTLNLPSRIPLLIQTAQAIEAAMSAAPTTK